MSADPRDDWRKLDPGLEEVLRELAGKQEARLLRVTRAPSRARALLFESKPAISSRTAGLLSAERKLLDVYREEVAYLLRRICLERIMLDQEARRRSSLYRRGDRKIELIPERRLRSLLRGQSRALMLAYPEDTSAMLIAEAARLPGEISIGPAQLALASIQLVPSDVARLYIGQIQCSGGSLITALQSFTYLVQNASSPEIRARARSWKASVLCTLGNHSASYQEYAELIETPFWVISDLTSSLAMAIQSGRQDEAARASRLVDELPQVEEKALDAWMHAVLEDRRLGAWKPSASAPGVISSILDGAGRAARRVIHVFS